VYGCGNRPLFEKLIHYRQFRDLPLNEDVWFTFSQNHSFSPDPM
jgi:hypothetical protein